MASGWAVIVGASRGSLWAATAKADQSPGSRMRLCLPEAQSSPLQDGDVMRMPGWALRVQRPPRRASVSPIKWSIDADGSGWGG